MFDFVHYFCLYKEFSLIMHFLVCSLSPYAYIKRRWQGWKQRREKRQLRCVCVCERVRACVCACVSTHTCIHSCMHTYVHVCLWMCCHLYILMILFVIFYRNSGSKWKMRLASYVHTLVTGISCNTNLYTKIKPTGAYFPVISKDQ